MIQTPSLVKTSLKFFFFLSCLVVIEIVMNRQTTDNTICGEIDIKLVPVIQRINLCPRNRAFSHDVTAAILVFQNKETAAMLVFQTSPMGVELFSYVKKCFCSH